MADNLLLPVSLEQMVGSDDSIFVAAVYVYDAGTTDLKNVYTDADLTTPADNPIIADGDGVLPARYVGTGSYKLVIKDTEGYPTEELSAHWTTFKTIDNLPGALDTSSYSSDKAIPITPVVSKTSDYTVLSTDQAKILDVDSTGGNVQITLPSAVTVGDSWRVTVKHTGSANTVTVATVGSQTIDGEESFLIDNQYEAVTVVSDGANWLVSETGRRIELIVLPRGYIDGCVLSNGSDATNDINVSQGVCRDITNTENITIDDAITGKQLDANWVAGNSAGMRYSGAGITDGTYGIFLARTDASSAGEIYAYPLTAGTNADTTAFHATVLAALQAEAVGSAYTYIRRIGSVVRASSSIRAFTQYPNGEFKLKSLARDLNNNPIGATANTATLSVPVGMMPRAIVTASLSLGGAVLGVSSYALLTSMDQTDTAASSTSFTNYIPASNDNVNDLFLSADSVFMQLRTNTSGQVRYRLSGSSSSLFYSIVTHGWFDDRGRDA